MTPALQTQGWLRFGEIFRMVASASAHRWGLFQVEAQGVHHVVLYRIVAVGSGRGGGTR